MTIPAFPLQWPAGWKRCTDRSFGRFGTKADHWKRSPITISLAVTRIREELDRMGLHHDDVVISTNLTLRLDGLPRSGQPEPKDPGAAAYWRDKSGATRCMAIDRYQRVADNLAAIAATLSAMRAIERHGGAEILDRAFTGFTALPPPEANASQWYEVLGVSAHAPTNDVRTAYRRKRSDTHPDRGGDPDEFKAISIAWLAFCRERGVEL